MELIETAVFSKQVHEAWSDEEYRAFQLHLILAPNAGALIPGSGGLRKIRWRMAGRGKRGGARVIYYWKSGAGQIFFCSCIPRMYGATCRPRSCEHCDG
jgi:mRNA-degrading endonuclease RelE of RelBE toxin-antitoxin system